MASHSPALPSAEVATPERQRSPLNRPLPDYYARALAIWPRLDLARSGRARHDPRRMASLIARRTRLPLESIRALLDGRPEPAGATAHRSR